jgi:CBS domain containing-hemolysin-like protein
VINIAGRIPEVEEEITYHNISFKILSKKGKKLHSILVHKFNPNKEN